MLCRPFHALAAAIPHEETEQPPKCFSPASPGQAGPGIAGPLAVADRSILSRPSPAISDTCATPSRWVVCKPRKSTCEVVCTQARMSA